MAIIMRESETFEADGLALEAKHVTHRTHLIDDSLYN